MIGDSLEPTAAQLSFVKDICDTLNIDEPEELTRESYSEFINEYKNQLYNKRDEFNRDGNRFIFWQ